MPLPHVQFCISTGLNQARLSGLSVGTFDGCFEASRLMLGFVERDGACGARTRRSRRNIDAVGRPIQLPHP